jgi:SAM-dependent methyltransferase
MIDIENGHATTLGRERADEAARVKARYARRQPEGWRGHALNPAVLLSMQERQRAIAELFLALGWLDLSRRRVMEVGCGTGCNLLEFIRFGFSPDHLQGIELLESSVARARRELPPSVRIAIGDAAGAAGFAVPEASQDIVYQSTVFSSLLDDEFQQRLAARMWRWLRPGGGILWYDFTMDNPRNPDVRGVPVARVRGLFPAGTMRVRRLTLAPPIARAVTRLHPAMYTIFNTLPWLRSHVLIWVEKPRGAEHDRPSDSILRSVPTSAL